MYIYLIAKHCKNGANIKFRCIYAPNKRTAIAIYRNLMHEPEVELYCERATTSGMLLARRDYPWRIRNSLQLIPPLEEK